MVSYRRCPPATGAASNDFETGKDGLFVECCTQRGGSRLARLSPVGKELQFYARCGPHGPCPLFAVSAFLCGQPIKRTPSYKKTGNAVGNWPILPPFPSVCMDGYPASGFVQAVLHARKEALPAAETLCGRFLFPLLWTRQPNQLLLKRR